MRNKDMLKNLKDVHILMVYLYSDKDHAVRAKNAIGATLELRMDEEGGINTRVVEPIAGARAQDRPMAYDDMLSIPILLGIIEQLQEQPADQFPDHFENR